MEPNEETNTLETESTNVDTATVENESTTEDTPIEQQVAEVDASIESEAEQAIEEDWETCESTQDVPQCPTWDSDWKGIV